MIETLRALCPTARGATFGAPVPGRGCWNGSVEAEACARPAHRLRNSRRAVVPIGSRAYDNRRLRAIAREVVGPEVLAIGYAQLPNPHLRRFHTVGVDLVKPLSPSGYAEEIQGDAMNLAACVSGRRFNTIVFGELIEHLEVPYQFLRSLHPFLAEGGRIVLSTPNPLGFPQVICEMLNIRRFYYTTEHHYSFPRRWMVRMLEATGFEVIAVRSVGLQLVCLAPPCPKFLSHQLVYVARQRGPRAEKEAR